jgi:hypothetical protein
MRIVSARSVFYRSQQFSTAVGSKRTFRPRCSKISRKVFKIPSDVKFSTFPPFPIVVKSASSA